MYPVCELKYRQGTREHASRWEVRDVTVAEGLAGAD